MRESTDILLERIRLWGVARNLHTADPKAQMVKLIEEVGELASGINRQNKDLIIDSVGDVVVVLTLLCSQLELDFNYCVAQAYNEIKDRKGKLINGTFIKENDILSNNNE